MWFGRSAPTLLDIGFGRGESLLSIAQARPDWNILGVEVHRPGIAWAIQSLKAADVENVRIIRGDVLWLLRDFVSTRMVSELRIFFPEPWPRAPERRLVRADTVSAFAARCVNGAHWRFATDDADYAAHAIAVWDSASCLKPSDTDGRCADRPMTVYETKGLDAGRRIVDLHYIFQGEGKRSG